MKLVTFTKDMAPHCAGESRVLPNDVADRLVAAGDARDPQPFPVSPDAAHAPLPEPARPRGLRYLTRKVG